MMLLTIILMLPQVFSQELPHDRREIDYGDASLSKEEVSEMEEQELKRQEIIQKANLQLELSKKKNSNKQGK